MPVLPSVDEKKRSKSRDEGRVLWMTDELSSHRYVKVLEASGFFVAMAEGGAKSLIALRSTRPHVVVADTRLKGVSAGELLRMQSGAPDAVPVILVGADEATPERRLHALEAGASDYFNLPSESPLLVARARQLVDHRLTLDRLRAEADRDYLTGLANRRRFRRSLGQEIERWRRYGVSCALLLMDIDHLKKINDAFGHPAGDRAIRYIASALTEFSRDNDTAARLGGEEFALLLAGVEGAKALAAAERLRESIASQPLDEIGAVTVSLGVAACPTHARTERELFTAADGSLYRAKREGRNRVILADELESVS